MLQELKSSEILDLLFICAKSVVEPISKPAVDSLVLIWQWYLRRSPSASFSLTQMSHFLPEMTAATAGDVVATAVDSNSATAVARGQEQRLKTSQLWSVTPVVDFPFDRTMNNSPHIQRASNATSFKPRQAQRGDPAAGSSAVSPRKSGAKGTADNAPPLPHTGTVRVSSGSLPAFSQTPTRAAPIWPSAARHDSSRGAVASSRPDAALEVLVAPKPRLSSVSAAAARVASSGLPAGGGQFVSQPNPNYASTSAVADSAAAGLLRPEATARNPVKAIDPISDPRVSPSIDQDTPVALSRVSLEQQNMLGSAAASVGASRLQDARRHSLMNPDSRRSISSFLSPFRSRSFSNKVNAAELAPTGQTSYQTLAPNQAPIAQQKSSSMPSSQSPATLAPNAEAAEYIQLPQAARLARQQMAPNAESALGLNSPKAARLAHQSAGSLPVAATSISPVSRADAENGLNQTMPEELDPRPDQARQLPAIRTSSPRSRQLRQPETLQYIESWLQANPEGHWQPFPLSHPSPATQGKAEALETVAFQPLQSPQGLERQSPAQLPPTPEGKQPTKRELQFSPASVTQPGAEVLHSHNLGQFCSICWRC